LIIAWCSIHATTAAAPLLSTSAADFTVDVVASQYAAAIQRLLLLLLTVDVVLEPDGQLECCQHVCQRDAERWQQQQQQQQEINISELQLQPQKSLHLLSLYLSPLIKERA
jgi:hypothetical protein